MIVDLDPYGLLKLAVEILQACDLINKINRRAIFQIDYCVCGDRRTEISTEIQDSYVLAARQIHPQIDVEGRSHNALGNGRRHSYQYITDFFRFEGFQKPRERMRFSNSSHLS